MCRIIGSVITVASRSIKDLVPEVEELAGKFLIACNELGISVLITCTRRSHAEQRALYAQGRETLKMVNSLRTLAKLGTITERGNKRRVTNAREGESLHNIGRAFDVVPLDGGKCLWDVKNPVWQRLGRIGQDLGLEWAGSWKRMKEYPHFQLREKR